MNINEVIRQLKQEGSRLGAAIQALDAISGASTAGMSTAKRRGRPPGSTKKPSPAGRTPKKRRRLSAAARKLISEAQKARWAKQKRAANQ